MAPNNTDTSNTSQDEFNFSVEFRPDTLLLETPNPETEWESKGIPNVPYSATINSLLDRVKKLVQDYLQGRPDFERKGMKTMMKNLTTKYNAGKDDSEKVDEDSYWLFRFCTTLVSKEGSKDLDTGIWQRLPNILDLTTDTASFKQEKKLKLTVHIEAERDVGRPIDDLDQDENLDRFVYPRRPNVTYVKVGSVQNDRKRPENFDLLQAPENETPIQRKNVILAQYDTVNDDVMSDDFKVLGSWRFMSPDNSSVYFRIGDFAGAQTKTMQDLTANNTILSKGYEVKDANGKPANPTVSDLRGEVVKTGREAIPPVLPTLTLNPFPKPDQLTDDKHELRKTKPPKPRVVVRFVYLAPSLNLDEKSNRRPRNLQTEINANIAPEDLEDWIFENWNNENPDDQLPASVTSTSHKLVWWVMHNKAEGEMETMYKVEDPAIWFVKYVDNAKKRQGKSVILYTECHVRKKDAPDEYTQEGL